MAPGLVGPEKAARGKLPTDTWWHTIVPTNGTERTGYPTQKPLGILKRIVRPRRAPGGLVLDFFAGSGTTGAACLALGRRFILVDNNPDALEVMARRFAAAPTSNGSASIRNHTKERETHENPDRSRHGRHHRRGPLRPDDARATPSTSGFAG